MIAEYQKLLESAFPASRDPGVYRAVSEGILLADGFIKDTPFLNTVVGRDMRGLLRRAGIMWRLHDLSQIGDVEYYTALVPMRRGRWHCIEIRSGIFKAHVCRTDEAGAFPEESMTRDTERAVNPQMDLFDDYKTIRLAQPVEDDELYSYLTFGVGGESSVAHLCWAMESRNGGDWVAFIDAMKRAKAYEEMRNKSVAEEPSKATKVKFHDFIQEAMHKQGLSENNTA